MSKAHISTHSSPPSTVFADQLFGNVVSGEFASAPNPLNGATQNVDFDKVLSQEQTFEKDYSQLVQDQRQTISLLVSEKNSLTETIERYNDIEARMAFAAPTCRFNSR